MKLFINTEKHEGIITKATMQIKLMGGTKVARKLFP